MGVRILVQSFYALLQKELKVVGRGYCDVGKMVE